MSTCKQCGREEKEHEHLTAEEFDAVTETFVERLSESMSRAGCNDVLPDEFPASVCSRFLLDSDVLEAWERHLSGLRGRS